MVCLGGDGVLGGSPPTVSNLYHKSATDPSLQPLAILVYTTAHTAFTTHRTTLTAPTAPTVLHPPHRNTLTPPHYTHRIAPTHNRATGTKGRGPRAGLEEVRAVDRDQRQNLPALRAHRSRPAGMGGRR